MHLIMLSGGSGKRLWPLSNDVRSKQFIKILENPKGKRESMCQRVHRQLNANKRWDSLNIVAGHTQSELLSSQLGGDINVIVEPERRDTFPAIALACAYLHSHCNVAPEECVCVLPVDSFVEDEYFERIKQIEDVLNAHEEAQLVLLGSVPVKPSEKYGYIVPKQFREGGELSDVEFFKEKPDLQYAQELIERGALWNCGVFGFRLKTVLNILEQQYGFEDLTFEYINENFSKLNKTSFDYEVVEKADCVKVLKYEGMWKDLGTWETLTEEIAETCHGNGLQDEYCENSHIVNELDIPIIGMGLKNTVVCASPDGILVANKGETYRLKEFVNGVEHRPMYEERRWGKYTVLEHKKHQQGQETLTKKLIIDEGKQISYQYHRYRKEVWTIASGEGVVYLEGKKRQVSQGYVVVIENMQKHGIRAVTELEIIEVQIGSKLVEEDIYRIELQW